MIENVFFIPRKRITETLSSPEKFQKNHLLNQNEIGEISAEIESYEKTTVDYNESILKQSEGDFLILEPSSIATSGNNGTSISSSISRAILRKGTSPKLLFNPQSVAISGNNGIAHAQSDLFIDFIVGEFH